VPQPDPQQPQRRPHWTFISVALFMLGLLILIPSGLCTALMGSFMVVENSNFDPSGILLLLLFGGIPMAAGAVLIWAGLKARTRD
jgi:hypothetical protein